MTRNDVQYNNVFVYAAPDYDFCYLTLPVDSKRATAPPMALGDYDFLGSVKDVVLTALDNSRLNRTNFATAVGTSQSWVSQATLGRICTNVTPAQPYNTMRRIVKFAMNPGLNYSARLPLEN